MKITKTITYEYEIDNEILKEYLDQVEPETEISFTDFIDWVETMYYLYEFEESVDSEYTGINNDCRINKAFLKEIKKIEND